MDIKTWIKAEIERGEDLEVIKGAVEILGFDPKLVYDVFKEIKQKKSQKIKEKAKGEKSDTKIEEKESVAVLQPNQTVNLTTVQAIKRKDKAKSQPQQQHYLNEQPVEMLEWHVPRELLPVEHHNAKVKEIKRYVLYLVVFLGISLILIGLYLLYFIRG